MIVKLVVLNRIDEVKGQWPPCVLGQLEETGGSLTPAKKGSIAESLVGVDLREIVRVDDRRATGHQVRR